MKIGLIADTRQDSEDSTATFSGVLETDLEEVDDTGDSEDDLAEQDSKDDALESKEDESILCSTINHVKEIDNDCISDNSVDVGEGIGDAIEPDLTDQCEPIPDIVVVHKRWKYQFEVKI